ncbi:S41 family peptidase [Ktedonospora formicarum]|uniref:Tail specific protease domain-containing protein n=1 Tax=Ktedonospora formicarum TaxID=2778364 RepID=A0A8J3HXX5_9CHLR|nr:S41 family peptidase [Ktedonospora formicarum]GHO42998.1 hypothetical protein KSX_11610 [Ktedonospora formicarum]
MQRISRQALQEDIHQLARTLAEAHPDPYTTRGGPIAFHHRVQKLLAGIPEDGMSQHQFSHYVHPLIAAPGDGHTQLFEPENPQETTTQPTRRLWLHWEIIEQEFYLAITCYAELEVLIGARLLAINDLALETLLQRMGTYQGYDNVYQNLHHLAQSLESPSLLALLLAQDEPPAEIRLTLKLADSSQKTLNVPLTAEQPGIPLEADSAFVLPPLNAARMCHTFLDAHYQVAYLRIESLLYYREHFEYLTTLGHTQNVDRWLEDVGHALPPEKTFPKTREERIAMVPAATSLLRDLFSAMRLAHTSTLIVDLRFCSDGGSFFTTILNYFLYGIGALQIENNGYQIKRYSPLYFENYTQDSSEQYAEAIRNGGYDYSDEMRWRQGPIFEHTTRARLQALTDLRLLSRHSLSFAREFQSRAYEAAWTPQVYVLTSTQTYSAGVTTAVSLLRHGAILIGTPPAQNGNSFSGGLSFTLKYSRIKGNIPFKRQILFPPDEGKEQIIRPHHELTYDYLASHNYDPNASIQLVLDTLAEA